MRFSSLAGPSLLGAALLAAGCYSRPAVPLDKPLPCQEVDASDNCPLGNACVLGICAPTSCNVDQDCPGGLVCTSKGCGVAHGDGGDGAVGVMIPAGRPDGGLVPDGLFADGTAPVSSDGAPSDTPVTVPDAGEGQ